MEKWLIPGLRQEINKMILEHLRVQENKTVLKNKTEPQNPIHIMLGVYQRDKSRLERALMGQSWNNLNNKINKGVLGL